MKKPKLSRKRYSPLPDIYTLFDKTSLWATFNAARTFAPEETPTINPSSFINLLVISTASLLLTLTTSPMRGISTKLGINPGPILWIMCELAFPLIITADSAGSTATAFTSG